LERVSSVYNVFASTMLSDAFQEVEREMEPRLAAHQDRIIQDEKLFGRIAKVYETREKSGLTAEQQRLAWLRYRNFARSGALLDSRAKERLPAINQRLAALYPEFSQNVLADEATYILLEREDDLAGLPESFRSGAAEAALARGKAGQWAILNTRSSVEPFLT